MNRVVIKEELVALTGDFRRALILNQFLYWSHRTRDYDEFLEEEKERDPSLDIEPTCGWIYKTAEELACELMLGCSAQTILRHIEPLVEAGWLQKRHNPKYGWDRTYQYRPDIHAIQGDLYALGYVLDDYPLLIELPDSPNFQSGKRTSKMENGSSKTEDQTVENGAAIPETTSQSTPETTADKTSGADAPVSPSTSEANDDLDPEELFTPSDHRSNGEYYTPRFHLTDDPAFDRVAGSDLKKKRGIPDWAMLQAQGPDPAFEVIRAFCELTGQSINALTSKRGTALLRHYTKLSGEHDLSVDHLAQAHKVLRGNDWGEWYLTKHKWRTAYEDSYVEMLALAASQIRDGRLEIAADGKATENIPDEILAQGTGYAAIMAHQRLKEKAARERGEEVPKSMWPSLRALEEVQEADP